MAEKFLALVLYPALADGLTNGEQETLEQVIKGMEEVNPAQIIDGISKRISTSEMSELAGQVPDAQKYHYYALAKQIAAADGLTTAEKIALQELSGALKITYDPEIFDIPEHDFD
jgi:hypothetical protein